MKKWVAGLAILIVLTILTVAPVTAQTFDNSGGGSWKEYMSFPITTTPSEYAQYKIVINGTTWELYNVTGSLEASGTNDNFWSLVNSTGADIRVFNDSGVQLYFWIEEWDYSNQQAVIWVNLTAGSSELNIAYRNPSASLSNYMDGKHVFELYDDFLSLSISPNGAWCWFQDPRAVYANGKTFFGVVNSNGDIVIYSYEHSTQKLENFTLHSAFEIDDHAAPAILVLPDGRLMVFYSKHNGNYLYYRISTNPYDISSWSQEYNISFSEYIGYPNPVYLSSEERIYVFFRYGTYLNKWAYIYSDDGGSTWSSPTVLFEYPTTSTLHQYLKIISNGVDKIYFTHSGHPELENNTSVYFFYYYNGSLYKADGTKIADISTGLPISRDDMDLVYNASATGTSAWIWDIAYDSNGYSVIVFATFPSTSDHRYYYAKWDGTAWKVNEIASAGGHIDGSDDPYYSGGITIDKENPNIVYFSKQDPNTNQFEVYKGTTTDGGSTWSFEQLTSNSPNKNVRPVAVRNHAEIKVLWMHGVYNSYTNYSTVIRNDWDGNFDTIWSIQNTGVTESDGVLTLETVSDASSAIYTSKPNPPIIIEGKFNLVHDGLLHVAFAWDGQFASQNNPHSGLSVIYYATTHDAIEIRSWSDGSTTTLASVSQSYTLGQWYKFRVIYDGNTVRAFLNGVEKASAQTTIDAGDYIGFIGSAASNNGYQVQIDDIKVLKLADPADFGTPLVKLFQKKFGTKTVYVNVTYLDTNVTERHNPPAYYKLENKPQINVTSMLSVSGVNTTYGANISIELIDFVTLDKVVYNGTDVTANLTYQGTVTNSTTGYVYNVYSFTIYEGGTLEVYGLVSNKAYEATYKLDRETVDIFNVTAVVGEALEITLPHRGNVTLASIVHTNVTSIIINTKDVGVGAKTLTITIDDPENFTVGFTSGTVNIDWGEVYFNVTDLQNKTLARTTYGFFNKNFSILSTDPTKLYAGDVEIDVYFHGVRLKSLEIYLNHTNNGLTLNASVNATQFKDYRNVTRIIASPNYFEVVNLSTKYPFSVMKLVNASGTIVIDFVSNAPTSVEVEGATSYTYEKPVLEITVSSNVTVTDLYRLSTPLKDRLGNPLNFYVLINGSRVDASNGVASKLLKPSWYEVEVPITVAGFELWKFNDSSNIALVEINASDKTLPTAEYRVPSKIETKEVRIQKTKFPWLPFPFPFLSESKPAQEETPIVRLKGTLRDFYNAPVANKIVRIEVASPNFTRIYNVTTDESGNFKIEVDMVRGVEYKVTYKFAGDDVYVGTSTTKTFTIEQLLPAPPEEMTITELLIFVGIAVGLVAVVAGAIYLAKRTKAKTLARMESEFRFFRRLK